MRNINYFQSNFQTIYDDILSTEQDSIWHAEGSVGIHTEMVLDELFNLKEYKECSEREQMILEYACFFHDLGKLKTTKKTDGRVSSPNHSHVGEKMFREIFYKNDLLFFEDREAIAMLIKYHGFPVHYYNKKEIEVVRLSYQVYSNKLLYILCKADMLGRVSKSGDMDEILYNVEYFKEKALEYDCYENAKEFPSDKARLHFLKTGVMYEPFEKELFTVTLLVGLPGTGKDYYIKSNLLGQEVISLDDLRRKNKVKRGDKKGEGRVIQEAKAQAKVLLSQKTSFVWNATNLSTSIRKPLIDLFHSYKATVKIVYLEQNYKQLLKQNNDREFPIPELAINNLIRKIDIPTLVEVEEISYIL